MMFVLSRLESKLANSKLSMFPEQPMNLVDYLCGSIVGFPV